MNTSDARVRYTRMIIEQSFLELLAQKPVSKITVTELCQKAQINRATFYKHYLDVQDLLEKLEEELFTSFRTGLQSEKLDIETFIVDLMYQTVREKDKFMALGSSNGDPDLMTKTLAVCYEVGYPLVQGNISGMAHDEGEMLYFFLSSGAGSVLSYWVRTGMRMPPEKVARFILDACSVTAKGMAARGADA